jgi:hypothetical protein
MPREPGLSSGTLVGDAQGFVSGSGNRRESEPWRLLALILSLRRLFARPSRTLRIVSAGRRADYAVTAYMAARTARRERARSHRNYPTGDNRFSTYVAARRVGSTSSIPTPELSR